MSKDEDSAISSCADESNDCFNMSDTCNTFEGEEIKEIEKSSRFKSNNPFADVGQIDSAATRSQLHEVMDLSMYPFKTLNRILDDLRWSILYKMYATTQEGWSILNRLPITYSEDLSSIVRNCNISLKYSIGILNEALPFAPAIETFELERGKTQLFVRGVIARGREVNHFRIIALIERGNGSKGIKIPNHEFHLVPNELLSERDRFIMRLTNTSNSTNHIDDAVFRASNEVENVTLRTTIFPPEFAEDDLKQLSDSEVIKKRYENCIELHPDAGLAPDSIPSPLHCFKTLLKVLKGPILFKPEDSIKTISASNLSLISQIEINFLLKRLNFQLKDEELIPPNINANIELRESYLRMVNETIFFLKLNNDPENNYSTMYSYNTDFSKVYRFLGEYELAVLQATDSDEANKLPYFINLSASTYYDDDKLINCLQRMLSCDTKNDMIYVDSMRRIINYRGRNSNVSKLKNALEEIQQKNDIVGYSDYQDALTNLGIPNTSSAIDDNVLITTYKDLYARDPKNYSYYNKLLRTIAKGKRSSILSNFLQKEIVPLDIAINELNIEEITEDEVVITAYEFKLDDILTNNGFNSSAAEISFLNNSLLSVAINRKSYVLMNYIELKLPSLICSGDNLDLSVSYSELGCDPSYSDFHIITEFEKRFSEAVGLENIRYLRQCLRKISSTRDSKILKSYLTSGQIDPSLLPAENWPAGLDNIGNTCYLNSLLQYYFCIAPLRDMVLSYDRRLKEEDLQLERKIGGRKVESSEIQRSCQFVYQLQALFSEMISSPDRCVQPGKELAFLAFLPLSQPVEFRTGSTESGGPMKEDMDIIEIESSDAEMEEINNQVNEPYVNSPTMTVDNIGTFPVEEKNKPKSILKSERPTSAFQSEEVDHTNTPKILSICADEIDSAIEIGRQQDVTECIENVNSQIETALEPESIDEDGEQIDIIKRLFYGKTKQTIVPVMGEGKTRVSLERFSSLIINVDDHPKDLYASLDNYFSEDEFDLEEGLVKKSQTIVELPEILQFHVQRVLFDKEKLMPYKSLEPIPFYETIYLDRYMDTEDEQILLKRKEVFQWKKQISDLEKTKAEFLSPDQSSNLSILDSLITTKKYLEFHSTSENKLGVKQETIDMIALEIKTIRNRIETVEKNISDLNMKVSNQFLDYKKVGFSIFAIFIHRGEASYGHYWIYIRDPVRNIYRKYNDENVTEAPLSEVMNFEIGNTATPYYIVYVKDELKFDYIEPLKREIR